MKTMLVFSHLRWNFVYQRPQHLLSRLAQYYKIIFMEEPLRTDQAPFMYEDVVAPNVTVLVPHTNEEGWGFSNAQMPAVGNLLAKHFEKTEIDIVWFYTPQALPLLALVDSEVVIFDVMDELSMFASAPRGLKERESELLKIADVVIASGPSLWKSKSMIRPDTILLPSAVDAAHYSPENAKRLEQETHVEDRLEHDIPHPRLGFFGVIDERLDIELVSALADANPEWHVVMVGPIVKIDPAILPQRHNIHWLGSQNYRDLPMIVQGWDVCILPFALNDSTKFISPTKTLEYMAAEKPIVSTNIHDVVELYGEVVGIGETHGEFIDQCMHALSYHGDKMATLIRKYEAIVAVHSWDSAAQVVHNAIEKTMKE